jgi:hypothetical protein
MFSLGGLGIKNVIFYYFFILFPGLLKRLQNRAMDLDYVNLVRNTGMIHNLCFARKAGIPSTYKRMCLSGNEGYALQYNKQII